MTPSAPPIELPASNTASAPGRAIRPYVGLALRERMGWVGLIFGICCLVTMIVVLFSALRAERASARVFVVDRAGTIHSGPLAMLADEPEFFKRLAMRATVAAFARSATADGVVFDNTEEVELLFTEKARGTLGAEVAASTKEFVTSQISQKPLVSAVRLLKEAGGQRLVSVRGRVERTGRFDGRPRRFYVDFRTVLSFVPNQRMELGDYPFVVTDLRTEYSSTTLQDEK